ncbi:putative sas10/Utp3/C1D family protein [Lyophyllum shimeji]|uniref:Sas10/Utp3/C1D family protein n=1 Tax=Lyophyllum shimeji TaxID=47721 RepID=A0A9P3PFS5_LYOSH|nr:putative sas10/Utp3/C1D family protein [Lyophyllum shimeji]
MIVVTDHAPIKDCGGHVFIGLINNLNRKAKKCFLFPHNHPTPQNGAASISRARESIHAIRENAGSLDLKDGISLLSLKHHILLSYLNSLVLVSSRRVIGHSLSGRSHPDQVFSAAERSSRGNGAGDLVDSMVEGRVILEKIRTLEMRMRYQIEKLVRVAHEPEKNVDSIDDPLAFRPNPSNLVDGDEAPDAAPDTSRDRPSQSENHDPHDATSKDGMYRPPRVAPVPYNEKSKSQLRKERAPLPSALASLSADPSRPHVESTSGLGSTPSLSSGRAAYLKRLNEYEEENFSRLVMKKSDAKRRARDEEDLALGGSLAAGGGRHRRRAGGLEDEFGDVLRSVERVRQRNGVGVKGMGTMS